MKRILPVFIFFLCYQQGYAQQQHFVYIQTENQQPFSVRLNNMILSSSGSGYIIIPKLDTGGYDLHFGFPKDQWPNQKMHIQVRNDQGYILKNFDGKGWGLFNIQTMNMVMNENAETVPDKKTVNEDGFADVLANVVGSPSIKEQPKKKVDSEPGKPAESKNSEPVLAHENKAVDAPKTDTVISKQETKDPVVISKIPLYTAPVKISSFLDATGRSMVYVDTLNGKMDTIRVFMPYPAEIKPVEKPETPVPQKTEKSDTIKTVIDEKSTAPQPVAKEMPEAKTETPPAVKKTAMVNSNCKDLADDRDFLKLRKKMAAQKSEDNMVIVARKDFDKHCYTTEQIKNLCVLFLTDKGRYDFFDAAYPFVSDSGNFPNLISELTEAYYINRFRAMIRN